MSAATGGTGATTGGGAIGQQSPGQKVTLSVKDARFETPLTHETSTVWFRRLRCACETLQCEAALTDDNAPDIHKRQAKHIITVNLPDSDTYLLDSQPSAKELYEKLLADYAGQSYVRKAELYQRLLELRPKHERLCDFLQRSLQLRADLTGAGIKDDVLVSACFLIGLRDADQFRDWVVQQLQQDPPRSLPELVSNLRTTFRHLLNETVLVHSPSAHNAQCAPNTCTYCRNSGHHILSCYKLRDDQAAHDRRRAARTESAPSSGHYYGRGRGRTAGRDRQHGRGRAGGRHHRPASHQVNAFSAIAFNAHSCNSSQEFLMDSCATHHMVCDRSFLTDFVPLDNKCRFADANLSVEVKGKGTTVLYNHEGKSQILKDVLYVPSFSTNLISLSQADAHGAFHNGGNGTMQVHDAAGALLLKGSLRAGLYYANCTVERHPVPQASTSSVPTNPVTPNAHAVALDAMLVHRRFGHVGMSTLAKMSQHGCVNNLPPAELFTAAMNDASVCGACKEGSQKASPFPRTPRLGIEHPTTWNHSRPLLL
jgi:hypothetical protein